MSEPTHPEHKKVEPRMRRFRCIPCTTPGCLSIKFFVGRCNPCRREVIRVDG